MPEETQYNISPMVKFSVFLGIYLELLLDVIPWVWGNLAVYVTSYRIAKIDTTEDDLQALTTWVFCLNSTGYCIGVLLAEPLAKRIGLWTTLSLTALVYNAGVLLTYFTINYSTFYFCLTFGIIPGISGGINQSCQLILIVRWTKRLHGLAASSVPSSNVLGSVGVNLMMTLFINPDNKEPNSHLEELQIFTQSDVVDRVPYAFLLFGCVSLVVSVIGLILIRENPGRDNIIIEMMSRFRHSRQETIPLRSRESQSIRDEQTQRNPIACSNDMQLIPDLTPIKVLRKPEFYAIWVAIAAHCYSYTILNTYYKEFGLLYIPNDYFLTAVVMVKCLCTPFFSLVTGLILDKCGTKLASVFNLLIFSLVACFFYLTPVNKWLYLISCVAYGCSLYTIFCLTSAYCLKLFGETHFTTIFGMALTPNYMLNPVLPFVLPWIISTHGWFVLFSSAGVLAVLNFIISLVLLPEKTMLEKQL